MVGACLAGEGGDPVTREIPADPRAVYHLAETPEMAEFLAARRAMRDVAQRIAEHMDNCAAWGGNCQHGCGVRERLQTQYRQARADEKSARKALGVTE